MWQQLTELTEAEFRHLADLRGDSTTSSLAETVRQISRKSYAHELAAVTAMGHLSLTTALTFNDQHHNWIHPSISISLDPRNKILVCYYPGGEKNPGLTASRIVETPQDAADYVDVLMNRMPYDTEKIVRAIATAEVRKREFNSSSLPEE